MAWFCKKCVSDGVMDEPWLEADENGIVFPDIDESQMTDTICEGCGPGWFDRYGNPVISSNCGTESCITDDEDTITHLEIENKLLKERIEKLNYQLMDYQVSDIYEKGYYNAQDTILQHIKIHFDNYIQGIKKPGVSQLSTLIDGYLHKIKNMKDTMSPTHKIELLNSEGPVLTLQKVGEYWSFSFDGSKVSLITDTREILDFLSGKKPIVHEGKMYLWDSYSQDMKPKMEVLSNFVISLMKDEINRCRDDQEYFFNTYYKTKK